jgi:hypothetical protein
MYRLIAIILGHEQARPILNELKTHLRGARIVLRGKTPERAQQEFFGPRTAHFAIRGPMSEAARKAAARLTLRRGLQDGFRKNTQFNINGTNRAPQRREPHREPQRGEQANRAGQYQRCRRAEPGG